MAATVEVLERTFRLGSMTLADPDPDASPEEALAYYHHAYPSLRHCTIGDPQVEDGRYVYPIHKPSATTKGSGGADGSAEDMRALDTALDEWVEGARDAAGPEMARVRACWGGASRTLQRMLSRPVPPEAFEARLIPLA